MKSLKSIILLVLSFCILSFAQAGNPRKMTVTIKTTVECAFCKKNLESKLIKVKGIKKVSADFAKKEVTVVYNSKRVSIEQIKKAIADIGYDADDVPANNKTQKSLEHKDQQNGGGK